MPHTEVPVKCWACTHHLQALLGAAGDLERPQRAGPRGGCGSTGGREAGSREEGRQVTRTRKLGCQTVRLWRSSVLMPQRRGTKMSEGRSQIWNL